MTRKVMGGYNTYGIPVGIIMLDTEFPRIPGDIGCADTFPFPVHYVSVSGATPARIVHDVDPAFLVPFVEAARELERAGVRAITTSCGFLAVFQAQMAAAVRVPVFTSSLLQVPLVARTLGVHHKVGILTASKPYLTRRHFEGVGWSPDDIPVVVQGMEDKEEFTRAVLGNRPEMDVDKVRGEVVSAAEELVRREPEVGALVLECTNLPPYSSAIHEATGLPVFDCVTLTHMAAASVMQAPYHGIM